MSFSYEKLRVESLLRMAKMTGDAQQRERYISMVESELEKIGSSDIDSAEVFIESIVRSEYEARTLRKEIYKLYSDFCEKRKLNRVSKNVLYRMLREHGVDEIKSYGNRYFKCDVYSQYREV